MLIVVLILNTERERVTCVVGVRGICAPSMPFPVITAVKRRSAEIQSELSTKAASFVLEKYFMARVIKAISLVLSNSFHTPLLLFD